MTDTRTTTTTTADERRVLADPGPDDRPMNDDRTQELSTADLAASAAPQREREQTEARPPRHETNIPEPTATPLFSDDAANDLRERWTDIQAGFVDEPRSSVEHADSLVAEVMKRLAEGFATERQALEQQWTAGEDASTEDLRVALRRYRSFFDRLLSI